jgi:mannose-6-phosphate isomerase-like protein (cupin superfamily)
MFQMLHRCDQRKGAIAAVEFEGKHYGAGVSFFVGNLLPGKGPGLHQHPYAETCIVLSGQAAMVVDGEEVVARAGDIVVIGSETPHRFTATGDEQLEMICIHASDHFVIDPIRETGFSGN